MLPPDDQEATLILVLSQIDPSWDMKDDPNTNDVILYNDSGVEIHSATLLSALNAAIRLYQGEYV